MAKLDNLSKDQLVNLYVNEKRSLEEIARLYKVSRVAIYKKLNITASKHQKNLYIFHFARENMVRQLGTLGVISKKSLVVRFPDVPENAWSYKFVYCHRDSIKLFNILYKNTQNGLFLDRKYKRFLEGFKAPSEGGAKNG